MLNCIKNDMQMMIYINIINVIKNKFMLSMKLLEPN